MGSYLSKENYYGKLESLIWSILYHSPGVRPLQRVCDQHSCEMRHSLHLLRHLDDPRYISAYSGPGGFRSFGTDVLASNCAYPHSVPAPHSGSGLF